MQTTQARPQTEPASLLFDALSEEMDQRLVRDPSDWKPLEMKRMLAVACKCSSDIDGPFISMEDIRKAEVHACGHSDYAAKFARQVAAIITRTEVAHA